MWNDVLALIREYMGIGLSIIAFVLALIYLWVKEKRKEFRIIFIYVPLALLLIYFNPWFAETVRKSSGGEGYYRILWLMPFTMVLAYAIVYAYGKISEKLRGIFACVFAALIIFAGSYMYGDSNFSRAENISYVPDSVIRICDAITVPGREVKAVFPEELLQYVRQYSPVTCMPYGADVPENAEAAGRDLYEMMEADIIYLDELAPLIEKYQCHYIVVPAGKVLIGIPEYFGIVWFGETDGYAIYRDVKVELLVP